MSPSSPIVQSGPVNFCQPESCDGHYVVSAQYVETEIREMKAHRRNIDGEIQMLKSFPSTLERSLAITKLQEGVMWLGMDLKRINEANPGASPNPYPNSKDPSNTKIEPTADGLRL